MKCRNPYVNAGRAFGCGQCLACRANRRREWTHRIMLESLQHSSSSFVTLTYDPLNLETLCGVGRVKQGAASYTLRRAHLTNFLKRYRKAIEPRQIRYFAVGEYGPRTERPHYHLAVFNSDVCYRGVTRPDLDYCCPTCEAYKRAWGYGAVQVGFLTGESAAYVAGYVTKKLIGGDAEGWLNGREPEFARMSNRPGIGHDSLYELVNTLFRDQVDCGDDVPGSLRHGCRVDPLGRYLRRKLRAMVGRDEKAPEYTLKVMEAGLSDVREAAFNASKSFKEAIIAAGQGEYDRFAAKQLIFKSRRSL